VKNKKWLKENEKRRKEGHEHCGDLAVIVDGDEVLMWWDAENGCYRLPLYPIYGC